MSTNPPFLSSLQLIQEPNNSSNTIPGQPTLPLDPGIIFSFLHNELNTPVLNEMYPHLSFVARKAADHIDALHIQVLKGRKILVTEDPALHLVWWNDVIFIKPMPVCLGNWTFWQSWMCRSVDRNKDNKIDVDIKNEAATAADWWCPVSAARGFLRSYAYLIRHPSDFRIAVDCALVPQHVDYATFSRFILCFRDLSDNMVAPRYEYGQLRLTRLNWAVRILRPKSAKGAWNYQEVYWQTGQYVSSFVGPLMFVFGSLGVMLSAMQVLVSIPDPGIVTDERGWSAFRLVSWGTAAVVTVLVLCIWLALLRGVFCLLLAQLVFSIRQLKRRKHKV
jgi:hypothetical protein